MTAPQDRTAPDVDLAAIEARANAATEGPWDIDSHNHLAHGCRCMSCYDQATVWQTTNGLFCEDVPREPNDFGREPERCEDFGYTYEDAVFIAHARTDVPVLLAEVRRLNAAGMAAVDEAERIAAERNRLAAEVERLRAGEADDPGDPACVPTIGEWLRRFNDMPAERRLAVIVGIRSNWRAVERVRELCFILEDEYATACANRSPHLQCTDECRRADNVLGRIRAALDGPDA